MVADRKLVRALEAEGGIAKIGKIPASGKLRNQDYLAKQYAHLLFFWVPAP